MNTIPYEVSAFLLSILGLPILMAVPLGVIIFIGIRQILLFRVELVHLFVGLSALPMLTPFFANLAGFRYFTWLNHDLQNNNILKLAAVLLVFVFTVSAMLGASLPALLRYRTEPISISSMTISGLFIINFVLMFFFLESGTILFSGYTQLKAEASPISSTVNQFFNLSASLAFAAISSIRRLSLIQTIILMFLILSILTSRRTLFIALTFLYAYTLGGDKIRLSHLIYFGVGVFLLIFIGEARSVGVINYLSGYRGPSWSQVYGLPGGASNVFVGVMGVIDLIGSGKLSFPESMPIVMWPFGENESTIYRNSGYDYNGGMHIAAVLYWNFGIVGLVLGGFIFGNICQSAGESLRNWRVGSSGTLGKMLSIAFLLTLPNTLWYSPIGLVKLSIAVLVSYALLLGLKKGLNERTAV